MDTNDTNQQIINELRTQTRIANRLNVFWLVIFSIILILYAVIATGYFDKTKIKYEMSWYDVELFMNRGDYDKALTGATSILKKTNDDWYSHSSIARIYLAKRDFLNAQKHYNIAYDLFPTKENEDALLAIKKIMAKCKKETTMKK